MTVLKYQRNQHIWGTKAFADKDIPACRPQEHSDFGQGRRPGRGQRGDIVSSSRKELLLSHGICIGSTRCGKTAGTGLTTTKQTLQPYDEVWIDGNGVEQSEERRVFNGFSDMKASKNVANTLEAMAREAGVPFYFVSDNPDNSWGFNPMALFTGSKGAPAHQASNFVSSLQLDLGPGYGAQHFTTQVQSLAIDVGEHLYKVWEHGGNPTIDEAIRFIRKNGKANPRDSDSLLSTLSLLRPYAHLQPRIDEDHVLDFYTMQKSPGLLCLSVDALNNPAIARLFGALTNSNVLAGRKRIVDEHVGDPSPIRRTYWVFDESHHLVSRNMASYLTGAAGLGLNYMLLVQSLSSFKAKDLDLRHDIWTNCAIKIIHTCSEEDDFRALQTLSRETVRPLGSRTVASDFRYVGRQAFSSENESDRPEPLTTRREIQELSAKPHRCYVILSEGEFSEPIPTDTMFAETYAEHLANDAKPWPKAPSFSKVEPSSSRPQSSPDGVPPWLAAHRSTDKSPLHAERISRFDKLLSKLRDEELPTNPGGR